MANSKLLKEAIADAKAVRETAIANAKIALEEAFTPRLQSLLSQKLQQEIEEGMLTVRPLRNSRAQKSCNMSELEDFLKGS